MASENIQKKSHRIALIASEYTLSQFPVILRHLLVGFADESIPVALICPRECNIDSFLLGSVEVIRYPEIELPFFSLYNNKLLIAELERFKPTILHCMCESMAPVTRKMAYRMNLPYVLMVNSLHKRFMRINISHHHCKKIIVPTKSIYDNIIKSKPHLADITIKINYGTYTNETTSCFSKQKQYITIIMTYPSHNTNDIENIFGAIRHLKINGYEFIIFLINNELFMSKFLYSSFFLRKIHNYISRLLQPSLWKMLNALDLAQIVTMIPKQTPWRLVLSSGDIFIYPRLNSAFNSILLEAMSVGNAIAATQNDVDDMIIDDETAVIFEPDDELKITRSLQKLLDRPEYARKIAANAQKYIKNNHSVSKMISEIIEVYNDI